METSYDDYDFDDDYKRDEPEAERDEWVLACHYPGCCMPGYHFRSECHNAEDMEAMYDEHETSPETQAAEYRHCEHGKPAGTSPCPTCYPAAEPSAPSHNCNCIGSCKGPLYGSRCRQL
jgi:hypothetical protein